MDSLERVHAHQFCSWAAVFASWLARALAASVTAWMNMLPLPRTRTGNCAATRMRTRRSDHGVRHRACCTLHVATETTLLNGCTDPIGDRCGVLRHANAVDFHHAPSDLHADSITLHPICTLTLLDRPHRRRDSPTSAPGLAHIGAGTLAHIGAGTDPKRGRVSSP